MDNADSRAEVKQVAKMLLMVLPLVALMLYFVFCAPWSYFKTVKEAQYEAARNQARAFIMDSRLDIDPNYKLEIMKRFKLTEADINIRNILNLAGGE